MPEGSTGAPHAEAATSNLTALERAKALAEKLRSEGLIDKPAFQEHTCEDGTTISVIDSHTGEPNSQFMVRIQPANGKGFIFSLDADGLSDIKIPAVTVSVGGQELTQMEAKTSRAGARFGQEPAGVLIDWAEKIVEDNRLSPPPIDLTF